MKQDVVIILVMLFSKRQRKVGWILLILKKGHQLSEHADTQIQMLFRSDKLWKI